MHMPYTILENAEALLWDGILRTLRPARVVLKVAELTRNKHSDSRRPRILHGFEGCLHHTMASITVTPESAQPSGRLKINNAVLSRSPAPPAREDGTASSSIKSALARSVTGTLAFYL